jgi:hypothetical protein
MTLVLFVVRDIKGILYYMVIFYESMGLEDKSDKKTCILLILHNLHNVRNTVVCVCATFYYGVALMLSRLSSTAGNKVI